MTAPVHQQRRFRLLEVTPRFYPHMGGIETHVYEVSRRFAQTGIDVTVLTTDPGGELQPEEYVEGVRVLRVRAYPADRDYYYAPAMAQIIRNGSWDLVHCQGYHTLVPPLAMWTALRAGLPFVLTFHGGGSSSAFRNAMRGTQHSLLRPLLARSRRLICVSEYEAAYFQRKLRLPPEHFVIVRNGAQLPELSEPAPTPDGSLIVSVGRLERYKGHHRAIAALPHVLAERPDARLRIVGGGPYEAELRNLAAGLGVAGRVEIGPIPPGDRQAMARLLAGAALFTLFSEYEGHPVAVMEALAMRRPALVADAPGLSELARRGWVQAIPLSSTPAATAAAILAQLRNPQLPPPIALPTWDSCAAELLSVYRSVSRRSGSMPEGAWTASGTEVSL